MIIREGRSSNISYVRSRRALSLSYAAATGNLHHSVIGQFGKVHRSEEIVRAAENRFSHRNTNCFLNILSISMVESAFIAALTHFL